jgi:hypothetical protein
MTGVDLLYNSFNLIPLFNRLDLFYFFIKGVLVLDRLYQLRIHWFLVAHELQVNLLV